MSDKPRIKGVEPKFAIPGGEIAVDCEGFDAGHASTSSLTLGGTPCRIVAASAERILAIVANVDSDGRMQLQIESNGSTSEPFTVVIGKFLVGDMHVVANPAVDPKDDAIVLTRSGSRGQHLPATLFRLEADGYLDELPDPVLNPTGIAFDHEGRMFVTNRAQGEVYDVSRDGTRSLYASGLGIATGIAFDAEGTMYVGDRAGTIYRLRDQMDSETFAVMEPSVAAYHMAFSPDGRLFVTAPGLASHDSIHVIDKDGFDDTFFRGLGRPQGLAFDREGNVYVAACYRGRHGIVRVASDGLSAGHFVAGNNVVGLCFTRSGEMIIATSDTVYSVPCGIEGTLLPDL